jgi:hypothetical protein
MDRACLSRAIALIKEQSSAVRNDRDIIAVSRVTVTALRELLLPATFSATVVWPQREK